MISRLIYNKGIIEFLKAANHFKNDKSLYFEIVGKEINDNLNEIKQADLAKYVKQENLKISNFSKDIKKKLKKANFVVLPSYREGMSKSLMEAMSSGIPVIASDVEGNSELVKNNYNGFLCYPKDYKSLYKCILRVSKMKKNIIKKFLKIVENLQKKFK